MEIFSLFTKAKIDDGVDEFRGTKDAVLLDVRTPAEYAEGHIPGSRNISLDNLSAVQTEIPQKDTPLFVHCRSGARSRQAVSFLKRMGYSNVKNIGGILDYHGEVERDR